MHDQRPVPEFRARAVRLWLLAAAAMIFLTLIVGGATRLTVSGPLDRRMEAGHRRAAAAERGAPGRPNSTKYKAIPQYRELNQGMSLAQFKVIYLWEWTHRLLARATGAVFLLPFLCFLWRGAIPPPLRPRLWLIFAGGAALGVVGWWMVASGLTGTLVKVSQYRLAFHMTLACAIYAAVLWTAQQIVPQPPRRGAQAAAPWRAGDCRVAAGADLSRRAGGRARCRTEIQYLAADRRRVHAAARPAAVHQTALAQSVREHTHGSARSPHAGRRHLAAGAVARDSTPGGCSVPRAARSFSPAR